jgi:serpin B
MARSTLPRNQSPTVSAEERAQLVASNIDFSLAFYQGLRQRQPGNLFLSPYSISTGLAMVYAGARAQTESEMREALHYALPQPRLHNALGWLDLEINRRGHGEQLKLEVTNAAFSPRGYPFEPPYLDTLAVHYDAGMHVVDFGNAPAAARAHINQWVSQRTGGRVTELFSPSAIDQMTRLVLANTIYFNAEWLKRFDPSETRNKLFHAPDGDVSVPTMSGHLGFRYHEGADFFAAALPYHGNQLEMVMVVPARASFASFEQSFDGAKLAHILAALRPVTLRLFMPKFRFGTQTSLVDVLQSMGMRDAFNRGRADLSGISSNRELYLTAVVHAAFIDVSERGTEATAATGSVVGARSAAPPPVEIDRPFLFFIRDVPTGVVLFTGRVTNPIR